MGQERRVLDLCREAAPGLSWTETTRDDRAEVRGPHLGIAVEAAGYDGAGRRVYAVCVMTLRPSLDGWERALTLRGPLLAQLLEGATKIARGRLAQIEAAVARSRAAIGGEGA